MGLLDVVFGILAVGEPEYNDCWMRLASDEELEEEREKVRLQLFEGKDVYDTLDRFDAEMSKRAWNGEEIGFPVHSEHGWYLSED